MEMAIIEKMKTMNLRKFFILLLTASAMFLVSCGTGSAEENQISIRGNGTVTADSFAAFPEEKYNITLFEEEAKQTVRAYNEEAGSRRIRLLSVSEENGTAHVTLRYRSCEDYTAFNRETLYYGTVTDGLTNLVFTGNTELRSIEDNKKVTLRELGAQEAAGEARYRIVAANTAAVIRCKGTPLFLSENAQLDDDGTIRINADAEEDYPQTAYIVYRK